MVTASLPIYDVDFYGDQFILDPHPHYEAMRALGPIVWLPRHGNFAATRYDTVRRMLRDHDAFVSGQGVAADQVGCDFLRGNTLASDPPRHDAMRIAMGAPLLPGALKAIRPRLERVAEQLVDDLVSRGSVDGVADVARVLPLTLVRDLVGLPEEGRENMLAWAAASFDILGVQNERGCRGMQTIKEMRHWIATKATADRLKPGSWTDRIVELARDGSIPQEFAPLLIRDYINPSLDTTIAATSELLFQLGRSPEQWDLIRGDPSLIPNAVQEAVRLASPIRSFSRTLRLDADLDGVPLPEGSRVMVLFASANRDERKFGDPHRFDATRFAFDHLGFGHGIHMCVGMHLARLEMEVLLEALAARIERIESGEPSFALNNTIRGYERFPLLVHDSRARQPREPRPAKTRKDSVAWLDVVVTRLTRATPDVVVLELARADGQPLPPSEAGAHIDVEIEPGLVRQYSLCGDPGDPSRFRIAILRERTSRGGSVAIHERFEPGRTLRIGRPRNLFPLHEAASRTRLFAAGIGITPVLAMAYRLHGADRDFSLHYAARNEGTAAFLSELRASPFSSRVKFHCSGGIPPDRIELARDLGPGQAGEHLFVCGPLGFIQFMTEGARELGWTDEQIHVERFGADPVVAGAPFTVVAQGSGKSVVVQANQTILQALSENGITAATSCMTGVCGTCLTAVMEGLPDHRDLVQTEAEKASNSMIAICCSRSRTARLVLDL